MPMDKIEGVSDDIMAQINKTFDEQLGSTVKTKVDASMASFTVEMDSLKSQISGLETKKTESQKTITETQEALAKASGDYSTLIESKENAFNEKLGEATTTINGLRKEKVDALSLASKASVVGIFADASKDIGQLAVNSLVRSEQNEAGEWGVVYIKPDGERADSIEALIESVKGNDQFAAHIKASSASGGGKPPAGGGSGTVDMKDKGQRQQMIKQKFGLAS